jgi:hypothetical protein
VIANVFEHRKGLEVAKISLGDLLSLGIVCQVAFAKNPSFGRKGKIRIKTCPVDSFPNSKPASTTPLLSNVASSAVIFSLKISALAVESGQLRQKLLPL